MAKGGSLTKICEAILKYSIYALIFLLPVLFLPWTSDVLDFNKQAFLILFVFVALFCWMVKVLISARFDASLNKAHIVVFVLFFVVLLSTIFSLDKYGSFWGWPRVTSESLLTLIGLVLLYFIISSVFTKKEISTSIFILMLSGFTTVLIGNMQLLGLFIIPFDFAKNTSFNTIGLVGGVGLFAAVLLPLLIILAIYAKKWLKIVIAVNIFLTIVLLILINYSIVWWLVLINCFLLILFITFKRELFDLRWLSLPMFFLALALFFLILQVQLPVPARSIEVYLNQSASFDIALKTLKDMPILGSGPGTFVFDFSKYKNVETNNELLWNLRFSNAGSKVLTILSTTGILGFVSFLALIAITLFYGVKFILNKESSYLQGDDNYYLAISGGALIGFISLTIGCFFYNLNLSLDFLFFFLIACIIGLIQRDKKEYPLNSSSFLTLAATFVFTILFTFGFGILILNGQRYIAEVKYLKGVSAFAAGHIDEGIRRLEGAVNLNPKSDLYLTQLSQAYLSKIRDVINQKDLSQDDKNKAFQFLVNNSINAAKTATDVCPKNVSNWSIRGFVYQNLIGLVPAAEDWAIKSYEQASVLEPTNPYYPTQEGIVYMARASIIDKDNDIQRNKDLNDAKDRFDKAVQLKSDYAPARFQIAMVYQAQGNTVQEIAALEEAKKYSPDDVGLLFQIGVVYYQKGDFSKAKSNLESAVAISPNYSNALYFLGLTYYKLGQNDKAAAQFQKISDLNPNDNQVKKILSNLQSGKDPLEEIVQENPPQAPVEETPPEKPKK